MFVTMVLAALIVDGLFGAARPDPDGPATLARRRLRHDRARLQVRAQRPRVRHLRGAVLADRAARRDRSRVRDEGRSRQGADRPGRRPHGVLLLARLPGGVHALSRERARGRRARRASQWWMADAAAASGRTQSSPSWTSSRRTLLPRRRAVRRCRPRRASYGGIVASDGGQSWTPCCSCSLSSPARC